VYLLLALVLLLKRAELLVVCVWGVFFNTPSSSLEVEAPLAGEYLNIFAFSRHNIN
jgi:hypothetical protein